MCISRAQALCKGAEPWSSAAGWRTQEVDAGSADGEGGNGAFEPHAFCAGAAARDGEAAAGAGLRRTSVATHPRLGPTK